MKKLLTLFISILFSAINLWSQEVITVARQAEVPLSLDGSYKSIQWELSSDNVAYYPVSGATGATYTYKAVSPAFIRAALTSNDNVKTYSKVYQVEFEAKTYLKTVKSSGGQAYAETNGKPAGGVLIHEDRNSSNNGLNLTAVSENWSNPDASIVWYLYQTAGDYDIDIVLNIKSGVTQQFEYSVTDLNNTGIAPVKSVISLKGTGSDQTLTILNVSVPKTSYYRYELKPLANPNNAVTVKSFRFKSLTSAVAEVHATNYLSSPSVHLSGWRSTDPTVAVGQKYDWCYQEILVPTGGDALSTYYMSLGVLKGYMGIQTNSPTQRGVIFSMWDDGDTDKDPTLDQFKRAGAVDHDPATTVSRFGNEGTGTKSFVNGWNWDTNVPVKFLTNARLEAYKDTFVNVKGADSIVSRQNTLISAWFNAGNEKGWQYISTLRLPNKISYFDSWYSFLENYGYANGQLKRYAYYYNGFAHEQSSNPAKPGRWISFNRVNFGNTDGAVGQRVDFEQGKSSDRPDAFYMSTGGYGMTKKTQNVIPLQTDKSVVESLDLNKFLERVDLAVAKEKKRNDSIKNITKNLALKTKWTIVGFSSEETTGEGTVNGRAACTIDNNPATFWHSAWQSGSASFPHYITVNMNATEKVTGFLFTLSGGTTRHQKGVELWGSTDGKTYKLMHSLNAPDAEKYYIALPEMWEIGYFKLIVKNSQTGVVHCRINEIDVTVSKTNTGIVNTADDKNTMEIYPNPAKESVSVRFPAAYQTTARIELLDLGGKIIHSQPFEQKATIDVSSVPAGVYVVRCNNKSVKLTVAK